MILNSRICAYNEDMDLKLFVGKPFYNGEIVIGKIVEGIAKDGYAECKCQLNEEGKDINTPYVFGIKDGTKEEILFQTKEDRDWFLARCCERAGGNNVEDYIAFERYVD